MATKTSGRKNPILVLRTRNNRRILNWVVMIKTVQNVRIWLSVYNLFYEPICQWWRIVIVFYDALILSQCMAFWAYIPRAGRKLLLFLPTRQDILILFFIRKEYENKWYNLLWHLIFYGNRVNLSIYFGTKYFFQSNS